MPSHEPHASLRTFLHTLALILLTVTAIAQDGPSSRAGRRVHVLFFGAPTQNGPHHDPITRYRVLKQALGIEGIDLTYVEDPAVAFSKQTLQHYDALLMYGNWAQHGRMPDDQLRALLGFVHAGGGFVPVHCASACYGRSPQFVRLVGARFARHGGEEFQVDDAAPDHPILRGLSKFKAWDETYEHADHADDRQILQTRDGEPWSWTRREGAGRVFYTASGHDHRVWDRREFQALLRNGILWAIGPQKRTLLKQFALPKPGTMKVSLPGYRTRSEVVEVQEALPPADSMKLAQVPTGMELSLFASEPDIVNPIHIAWDHRGRAFVIETIDYPNNLQAGNLGNDRITICQDDDGDGRADRFTRFAEKLSIPTSLCFARGGVICTNGSEMLYLRDTDGDDEADVREVLFSGFNMGDTHAGVSNLRYGIDGWVYATIGYSGFRGTVGGEQHQFGQGVFRFLPDGSKLEFLQNTTNNTWGLGFTEQFDVVGSTANGNPSFYLTFPRRAYEAAGLEQGRTPRADDNPKFFPASTDIRQVDQFDRYTAAAGHAVYTARRFSERYHNRVAFVCGPTGKLVGEFVLERHGAGFRAVQSANNLFCSADAWTSPVCAEVGPDGAVWVLDWYNVVVQHNPTPNKRSSGIDAKNGRGNAYVTPHRDKQHGRIYRVYPRGTSDDANPTLTRAQPASLLRALFHANQVWRLHAQRLLVESGNTSIRQQLERFVTDAGVAAPHALHALDGLGALRPEILTAALTAPTSDVRRAAISLATPQDLKACCIRNRSLPARGRELAEILVGFARAADDPAIGEAIFRVANDLGSTLFDEPALRDAWIMAARRQSASVLGAAARAGVATNAETQSKNLLPNADFELVDGTTPAGWNDVRYYGGARAESVRANSSPNGRNGTKCLKVTSANWSDCGVAAVVPLRGGARYRLSGFVRTEGITPRRGPGAMMNVHGGRQTKGVVGTQGWTEVSVEFEAGHDHDAIIHCLFGGYGGATGTAYWDDVSLVEIGSGRTLAGAIEALEAYANKPVIQPMAKVRTHKIDPEVHMRGAAVFAKTCIACHGIEGRGVPQAFPPLDGAAWATGDPSVPIRIVLHGLMGPIQVKGEKYEQVMAPLGPALNDREIADVLTFIRQSWSNDASAVEPSEVEALRKKYAPRPMWTAAELGL